MIKTEVPWDCGDHAYQKFLFQQCEERIEKLSQQDKFSKFCMDAGFLSVVENGQYFMTKKIGDFTHNSIHWFIVNTRFRVKEQHHNRKDKFRETHLHGEHGVEIRILFLKQTQ